MRNRAPFRHAVALMATVSAGLALVGCNNNPYPPGESNHNVLYMTMSDDPKSLDPSFSYTVGEAVVTDVIYPCYFKYDYLKRDPMALVLNVGAKQPVIEPTPVTVKDKDGKEQTKQGVRYTFTIRQDLRFQDDACFLTGEDAKKAREQIDKGEKPFKEGPGRAITAKDIVYSFKRMADPRVECPVASYFADKVIGWNDYSDAFPSKGKPAAPGAKDHYDEEMAGVQLDPNDPYTFHVLTSEPYPQLMYLMTMHFTTPQAREAVEYYGKDEYARHPVGCGPFKMTEYKPRQRIVLDRAPNGLKGTYPTVGMPGDAENGLLEDAGQPLPRCDRAILSIVKEGVTAWNLFQQGYLDSAGVGRLNFQQAITPNGTLSPEMKAKGIILRKDIGLDVYYFAFNMSDATFGGYDEKHKKLRQAISLSINAQEYIDVLLQGQGLAAEWLLPPSITGYDKDYKNPYRYGAGDYNKNIEKAKQLLAEAGYPNGVGPDGQKLVLHWDNTAITPDAQQTVGIVIKMIERIGIKVESRSTRPTTFQEKLLKGEHQFIQYGWVADYPDPENFVFLLYGPNRKPGPNSADYANPEYDKLFEQMRSMKDGPERDALIKKLRDISAEDCPWIPIFHSAALSLNYDWLKNVKTHPVAQDFVQYERVDFEKRDRLQHEWNHPNFVPLVLIVVLVVGGFLPAVKVIQNRVNRRVRKADGGPVV